MLAPGTDYQFTAFVRLAPGESATQVRMTMRRTPSGGSAVVRAGGGEHRGQRDRLGDGAGHI